MLALCLLVSAAGFAEDKAAAGLAVEKSVVLYAEGVEDGRLSICFFSDQPGIPCMGIRAYADRVLGIPMTMETDENGVVTLRNGSGGELTCDPAAGTVSTRDWVRVISPDLPLEGRAAGLKDSSCAFVRITEIVYEGDPKPVTFDFAKYGMKVRSDGRDVYLPLSVLSNMLTDVATRHLRYDGTNLYLDRYMPGGDAEDPVLTGKGLSELIAGKERPADLAAQCYAGLCFNLDYFFGHPGVAAADAALAEKGLDGMLEDMGEEGRAIRAGLLSPDMTEYLASLAKLFTVCLYDGHTNALDVMGLANVPAYAENREMQERVFTGSMNDMLTSKNSLTQIVRLAITPQRKLAWGDEVYRESGSTAIIRLDTFMPDEAAWDLYYKGEGPFPSDCLGSLVTGLRQAQANPEITNVIFDLTCNSGGSSDVLMVILGLTTGRNYLLGRNTLTGQTMRAVFETDCNFDGVFDEKDREARFDFNYGVLTTRQAFSCGNLFPVVMRESGAAVVGETTGGGSCCIQIGTDEHSLRYVMSSCQWQLLDENGASVESGCAVDIPIRPLSVGFLDRIVGSMGVDEGLPLYAAFFDADRLNDLMNDWFRVTELAPAA